MNGQDVSQMNHGDIVTLIKASSTQLKLIVQQPEDLEAVKKHTKEMLLIDDSDRDLFENMLEEE